MDKLPPFICGNWKMYKTKKEGEAFIEAITSFVKNLSFPIYLAVPYTLLYSMVEKAKGLPIQIGAQNMNAADPGAFTGEIAAKMVKDTGASFVILGHYERRKFFNETNEMIHAKVLKAVEIGLEVILCIGESLEAHENNTTEEVLKEQLNKGLAEVDFSKVTALRVSYEPYWAIGSGLTPTPLQIEESLRFCKKIVQEMKGEEVLSKIHFLYGGSVKKENVASLIALAEVEGVLLGGVSLTATTFIEVVEEALRSLEVTAQAVDTLEEMRHEVLTETANLEISEETERKEDI